MLRNLLFQGDNKLALKGSSERAILPRIGAVGGRVRARLAVMSLAVLFLSVWLPHGLAQSNAVPIETKADFAVITDFETGEVLFSKRANEPTAPASMSKLMTAAIVFEKLQKGEIALDSPFRVSKKAWQWQGSKMWVLVDTEITVENLLRGLIIQSGNDAAIVLAENISGSESAFAELMNQKAREWGLVNSTFANATGWPDPLQRMSMMDLARLAEKIIREFPEYYAIFNEREFTWSKITQENRNPLLRAFDGADGLKTGHTEEAGYGVVGSAKIGNQRRIIVIGGTDSANERLREARRLMRISFDDFSHHIFFRPGDEIANAEIFKGKAKQVPLVTGEVIDFIIHKSLVNKVKATAVYEGPISAPVLPDQQIGYLRVEVPGREPRDYPLFAANSVEEMDWLGKIGLAARKLLLKPEAQDQRSAGQGAGR